MRKIKSVVIFNYFTNMPKQRGNGGFLSRFDGDLTGLIGHLTDYVECLPENSSIPKGDSHPGYSETTPIIPLLEPHPKTAPSNFQSRVELFLFSLFTCNQIYFSVTFLRRKHLDANDLYFVLPPTFLMESERTDKGKELFAALCKFTRVAT